MIFTIREYTENSVIVDYEDGSYANVPLTDAMINDPAHLAEEIEKFGPKPEVEWIDNAAIPEGTTVNTNDPTYQVPEPAVPADIVTYTDAREYLYPTVGDQLDADYWTRHGRPEDQVAIDEKIAWVQSTVPKDWAPRSRDEFVRWLETVE